MNRKSNPLDNRLVPCTDCKIGIVKGTESGTKQEPLCHACWQKRQSK